MAEHTPTPWQGCKNGDCQCGYIFGDEGEVYVAQALNPKNIGPSGPDPYPTFECGQSNAKFIVRAVNCHDELLAALKEALAVCDSATMNDSDDPSDVSSDQSALDKVRKRAHAIIAKATS